MNPVIPGIIAAVLYLGGTWLQIKSFIDRAVNPPPLIRYLAIPAMLLHAVSLFLLMNTPTGINLGIFIVLSLTGLILAFVVFVSSLRLPLYNLFIFAFPLAILGLFASLLFSNEYDPAIHMDPGLLVHVLSSIFAYSLLLMAACQALILLVQARFLSAKASIGVLRLLPPLETMEHSLFSLLKAGVSLLTLSIISGFVFLEDMFAQHVVHHTALSLASWAIFVALLIGRRYLGWRGRVAIRWTLFGFLLLLAAYFGSKLVMEVIIAN
jgi:ABC-type uncharacterized transport system permease subunit